MKLFGKPEPEPEPKWVCADVTKVELGRIEEECRREEVYCEVEEAEDGNFRVFFYEEDWDVADKIVEKSREKSERPKHGWIDEVINAAKNRTQSKTQNPKLVEPPTDIENRWAEEQLARELKEAQIEIEEVARKPLADVRPEKRRKSLGRTNQIKTRLTDTELVQFQRRVKKSGLAQGDFLRTAALAGQIVIEDHSVADVAMLDELAMIRAELGRQGGLLKMIIKPNEGQRELAPEEWTELIGAVRGMEKIKKRLSDLEVKVQYGNRKAQNK